MESKIKKADIWAQELDLKSTFEIAPLLFQEIASIIAEAQKQAIEAALEEACINADVKKIGNSGSWYDAGVDTDSILSLKDSEELKVL